VVRRREVPGSNLVRNTEYHDYSWFSEVSPGERWDVSLKQAPNVLSESLLELR
jgi:hypothetical protein